MKVTIKLTDAEVAGIKNYLKEIDGIKPKKADVVLYVQGLIDIIHAPQEAVSHYISEAEKKMEGIL